VYLLVLLCERNHVCFVYLAIGKKGKAVPLQAWSGPDGSRKLRFPYFMTTAQEGCQPYAPAAFTHFC